MLSNYRIEIDAVTKDEWTELLLQFDDATIYQTWSYGAIRWGQSNLSHIVIKENDEIVAAAQLRIVKIPLLKAGIAYLPWGPMWRRQRKQVNIDIFQKIISTLKEEYAMKQGLLLRIHPNIIDENSEAIVSILNKAVFQKSIKINPYRTLVLDLSPTMSEIRKTIDQKWRNQLNRSEKNSLTTVEGNSDDLYQIFLNLQNEMLERKKYQPGVDYDEFREIQKNLPEQLKMRVFICEYEGDPVTATIGSAIGDTGIYLFGATGDKGLQLKGAYLSQWLMIRWLKGIGCKWYDLGGINPERNPGVYHFKVGLSGNDVRHIGQYEFSENAVSTVAIRYIERFRRAFHQNL